MPFISRRARLHLSDEDSSYLERLAQSRTEPVSGGGGGGHFGGPESATPPMLGGTEWRLGGVRVNRHSALRAGIFKA